VNVIVRAVAQVALGGTGWSGPGKAGCRLPPWRNSRRATQYRHGVRSHRYRPGWRSRLLAAAIIGAVAAGTIVAVNLTGAGPAGAVATEAYPLPANGAWTITGRGFGHGRGMSQWGSQGAAKQGLSGSQILAFYYPGTTTTTIPAADIRVLISGDEGTDTVVGAQPGLAVRDAASNALYTLPAGPTRWRAVSDAAGLHIELRSGTSWLRWTAPDANDTWAGPLRFGIGATTVLTLYIGNTAVQYRGKMVAVKTGPTALETVNTLPLDAYLYSVVPAESPASWLPAALRSQAVAARTYAAFKRARHTADPWDICDTTACQVYKGVVSEAASTTAAVQATANQIRALGGQPIVAEFSASNGGYTVASSLPYQVAKVDPYDAAGGANPNTLWTVSLTTAEVRSRYPQIGQPQALRVITRDGHGAWGGRITDMFIDGSSGSVELTGDGARIILKSTWWLPKPTVTGPAVVARGSTVQLRGTARAGDAVEVWFHRQNVPGYTLRRRLTADSAGRWSTSYLADVDHRYYAVSYGQRSNIGLTQVR
jgi:stage II sporulation protein D